ncbi:VUT family protein [Thiotrichales bacterium 19X7-9]|nr:VUT family protein [Thiotrichales bacterium 19X7-9]
MRIVINYLFGEIEKKKFVEFFLCLLFFISLFSATCFFFDHKELNIWDYKINFPVGLLFFPLTFVISNIIQDFYGKKTANTVVACSFIADILLVAISLIIASVGDRNDYYTVFKDLPTIMGATLIFLAVSSSFNIFIYGKIKKICSSSVLGMAISFFGSTTAAEILTSSMSMPLLFYKEGISGSILLSISVIVIYKLSFNFIATLGYIFAVEKFK